MPQAPATQAERWSLIDLKLGIMFLRSLYMTGLTPAESLDELTRLQPKHAEFWLGASRHTKAGKPLHDYLAGRWPDNLVSPIRIAETSGRLDDVFLSMTKTLQQQIDARKLLNKMYYPLAVMVGGIGAAVFVIAFVIPTMMGKLRLDKPPMIITFARSAQAFLSDYGYMILGTIIAVVAAGIWKWREDEQFRSTALALINHIPILGWSTRWIWFSVWANYAAIMIKADISMADTFRTTTNTLPPHLQGAISRIVVQLERGQTLTQAATPSKDAADPRHLLPIHITNAFRMTDRSGQGATQFALASETLFEPGKEMLAMSISTITNIMLLIAGILTVSPFAIYLKTVAGMAQSISAAR